MVDETREVMNVRQAAAYLGITSDTLYKYAEANTVPGFKLGNRWRFKKSVLDNWMEEQSGTSRNIDSGYADLIERNGYN